MSIYQESEHRGLYRIEQLLQSANKKPNKLFLLLRTHRTIIFLISSVALTIVVFWAIWHSQQSAPDYSPALNRLAAITADCKGLDPAATLKEAVSVGSSLAVKSTDLTDTQQLKAMHFLIHHFDTGCINR